MGPELSIVIVEHDSGPLLAECLASLAEDPAFAAAEVLVIDNGGGRSEAAVRGYANIRVVNTDNRGFGAANNVGIQLCSAPYVMIANPDTLLGSGTLGDLVAFLRAHPGAGLVGPKLLNPDGSLQLSMCNYPTVLRETFECFFLHRLWPRLTSRFADIVQDKGEYETARRCDWVLGAAMLARTDALREVGGFDEGFFLYSEEIDLCRRLTDAGWEVWYDPEVEIVHVGGSYHANAFLSVEKQRSRLRYFRKHQGVGRMLAFSGVIAVRLTIRTILWFAAAALKGGSWGPQARATLATLWRYPRLVVDALLASAPVTLSPEWGERR